MQSSVCGVPMTLAGEGGGMKFRLEYFYLHKGTLESCIRKH